MSRARGVGRDIELMTRVASQYYLEGMTQEAVARSLRLSRPKVGRLLDRARTVGIVEITVNVHPDIGLQVEAALASAFGLDQVMLVNDQTEESGQRASVARAAAGFLKRQLSDGDVVALGMGRNVGAVPDFIGTPPPRAATFVSAIGGSPLVDSDVNPNEICRRLAEAFRGSCRDALRARLCGDAGGARRVHAARRRARWPRARSSGEHRTDRSRQRSR